MRTLTGIQRPPQNGSLRCGSLTEKDLATPGLVFQIGIAPIRIDVLTAIDGVEFTKAWTARYSTHFADQPVGVLSIEDLIKNKRATAGLKT